jgi:hypothetical protein
MPSRRSSADPDPNRTTDEIVTQIVAIKYSSVNDLSALLRPLISTRGTLIAHRETNVLIITDTASNITRLLDIIRLVDVQVAQRAADHPGHVRRLGVAGDDPDPALRHGRIPLRRRPARRRRRRAAASRRASSRPDGRAPGASAEAGALVSFGAPARNSLIVHARSTRSRRSGAGLAARREHLRRRRVFIYLR